MTGRSYAFAAWLYRQCNGSPFFCSTATATLTFTAGADRSLGLNVPYSGGYQQYQYELTYTGLSGTVLVCLEIVDFGGPYYVSSIIGIDDVTVVPVEPVPVEPGPGKGRRG